LFYRMSSKSSKYFSAINSETDDKERFNPNSDEIDSSDSSSDQSSEEYEIPSSQVCAATPEKTKPPRRYPIKLEREC